MPAALTPAIEEFALYVGEYFGSSALVSAVAVIGEILAYAAVAELILQAQKALSPNAKSGIGANLESSYYSSEASIRIIYGTVKAGGMRAVKP